MGALEEIEAAIEKLAVMAYAGDSLEWVVAGWHDGTAIPKAWADYDNSIDQPKPHHNFAAINSSGPNVALIVTLYRTIDAQLRILRANVRAAEEYPSCDEPGGFEDALNLAHSINGGA